LRLTPCGVRDRRSKFLERDDELNANDGFNLVQLEALRIQLRSVETVWYSGKMRMLRLWIEAQPTLVIVLVVFGIAYLSLPWFSFWSAWSPRAGSITSNRYRRGR
jgi:hypothetical protein